MVCDTSIYKVRMGSHRTSVVWALLVKLASASPGNRDGVAANGVGKRWAIRQDLSPTRTPTSLGIIEGANRVSALAGFGA